MIAVYGSQSTPRVLMVNTNLYSSFSGCNNGLQNKKTILTIQTVKYFEQIGDFTLVKSAKIPHVCNERLYTQASNVIIVKTADHTLVGRALGFTPNKIRGLP